MESKDLDRAKKEFITISAHKLLTPLSVIKWNLEIAKREGISADELKKAIESIEENVNKLIMFDNILLKISEQFDSNIQIDYQEVNLNEAFEAARDSISKLIPDKRIEAIIEIEGDPIKSITLSKEELQFIFEALIKNAAYYSTSEIKISIYVSESDGKLVITSLDSGVEINEADSDLIFSGFFRTEEVKKLDVKGYGLDLYLCKLYISKVGGMISFEKASDGNKFVITLPIKQ